MKLYRFIFIQLVIIMLNSTVSAQEKTGFNSSVRKAVERQLEIYPASTLKDLYKNFFQDKYGPGHLINDLDAAGNYLQRELSTMTESSGDLIEPTGWEGNFYRVNLSLIKEGVIPYELFFDAFVRSVNSIQPVPVTEWEQEWKSIEQIIAGMNLSLSGYKEDKLFIEQQLKQGEYVGHHSEIFEKTYSPHYRIISKDIFEKELLSLLEQYLKSQY